MYYNYMINNLVNPLCMVVMQDKNDSVVCGRMLAGKIPAS